MPMFDFRCPQCGHEFEAFVRASVIPPCTNCKAETVERKLSAFGVGVSSRDSGGGYLGKMGGGRGAFGCGAGCACH